MFSFQAYRVVSSSRSNYIEHMNILQERAQSRKGRGELRSSLLFPRHTRVWNRFLHSLIRPYPCPSPRLSSVTGSKDNHGCAVFCNKVASAQILGTDLTLRQWIWPVSNVQESIWIERVNMWTINCILGICIWFTGSLMKLD